MIRIVMPPIVYDVHEVLDMTRTDAARLAIFLTFSALVPALGQSQTAPQDVKPGSITYEDIPYPYPVSYLPLTLYGQDVPMASMDVPPAGAPNRLPIVVFHGI